MAGKLGADAQLKVSTEELKAKSASVSGLAKKMKTQYDALRSIVNSSSGYWVGNGGDCHRKKFTTQEKDVEEMFNRINEHVVDLLTMAGVYEQTESNINTQIQDTLPSDVII